MSTANRVRLVRAVLLVTARVRPEHAKVPALNVRISVSAETRQRAQRSKHVAIPHAKRQAVTETSSHRTEDQILVPTTHPALRGLTGRQHCSPRVCDTAHAGSDSRPRKGGLPSTQKRCGRQRRQTSRKVAHKNLPARRLGRAGRPLRKRFRH